MIRLYLFIFVGIRHCYKIIEMLVKIHLTIRLLENDQTRF